MNITRQLRIGNRDDFTPAKLQYIADHFKISNANACLFALHWEYGISGKPFGNFQLKGAGMSKTIFLYFSKAQLDHAEETARYYGISLIQLAKRAIKDVAQQIEAETLEDYHPTVRAFFKWGPTND